MIGMKEIVSLQIGADAFIAVAGVRTWPKPPETADFRNRRQSDPNARIAPETFFGNGHFRSRPDAEIPPLN
jgi:hypothetical protein